MKILRCFLPLLVLFPLAGRGQGTLIFDQQSSTDETPIPPRLSGGWLPFWGTTPIQGFTPTLSSVDFVRFQVAGPGLGTGTGLVWASLMTSEIGPVIATTATNALPGEFAGPTSLSFPSSVSLTPGSQYFFLIQNYAQHAWVVGTGHYNYTGGDSYFGPGIVLSGGLQYWFREGVVVPSTPSFGAVGVVSNQFGFKITGTPDIPIVVEACTDPTSTAWTPLQSCTLTNGSIYFSDPNWTNSPARFYRVHSP